MEVEQYFEKYFHEKSKPIDAVFQRLIEKVTPHFNKKVSVVFSRHYNSQYFLFNRIVSFVIPDYQDKDIEDYGIEDYGIEVVIDSHPDTPVYKNPGWKEQSEKQFYVTTDIARANGQILKSMPEQLLLFKDDVLQETSFRFPEDIEDFLLTNAHLIVEAINSGYYNK